MKSLILFFKKILTKDSPKHLGRWNNEQCNIKINQKVDLSNEDHCGPCGQYALIKQNIPNNLQKENYVKDLLRKD
jgi:hypothetical protein